MSEKNEKWINESDENHGLHKGVVLLRNENNKLRTKVNWLKEKLKENTKKRLSTNTVRQTEPPSCICTLKYSSNAKETGSSFDAAELNKTCRKIIELTVFSLSMTELQYIHNVIYIASIEKDPFTKTPQVPDTYDLNGHKDRMEFLENELTETTKRLKSFMKPRAHCNRPQKT